MCRLLGWATRVPTTLTALLGDDDLGDFTALSSKHGDGWGLAWSTGRGVAVHKSPDAARASDDFAERARSHPSDLGMVHLRWATLGLAVKYENTHPFSDGRLAFAHNGSVRPPASLDDMLTDDVMALKHGSTDSERYFLAVLSKLDDAAPGDALAQTVSEIAAGSDFTSLNCLLITPDWLYAVCRFNPIAPTQEEGPDYFNLGYRISDDSVVVSSSGWGRGWQEIGNGDMLAVRRETLEVSVRSIEDMRVAS
jgi:predicted glutamine amidotransferase